MHPVENWWYTHLAKINQWCIVTSSLIAVILLTDYFYNTPQKMVVEELSAQYSSVKRTRTGFYTVYGQGITLHCSPTFFYPLKEGNTVNVTISRIFGQVHSYQLEGKTDQPEVFTFRRLTGLILPGLFIGMLILFLVTQNGSASFFVRVLLTFLVMDLVYQLCAGYAT